MLQSASRNLIALLLLVLFQIFPVLAADASNLFDIEAALHYVPSKTVGTIGFVIFLLIGAGLSWRLFRNRDWWALCLPIGVFLEALGFLLRIFNGQPSFRTSKGYFIAMNLFVVLSPTAFLAFNYIVFGRLILFCAGRENSYIRPELLGRTFLISDLVTFIIQAVGKSLQLRIATATSGRYIFLAGLLLQMLSYMVYLWVVKLSRQSIRSPKALAVRDIHGEPWYKLYNILGVSSFWIMIRTVYRILETAGGDGYLLTHEWVLVAFDAIPLALSVLIYVVYWPGNYFHQGGRNYRSKEQYDLHTVLPEESLRSSQPLLDSEWPAKF